MNEAKRRRRSISGSIFTTLLAGVALVGAVGFMAYQTLSGPVATMSRVTKKAAVDTQINAIAKLIISNATSAATSAGDCDGDNYVEFAQATTSSPRVGPVWNNDAGAAQTYGGQIPVQTVVGGLPTKDSWGTPYGYCVWDVGAKNNPATAGTDAVNCPASANRLTGANATQMISGSANLQTVLAVVSAGPDRLFQTTCNNYVYAASLTPPDMVNTTSGSDDVVVRYSYAQAQQFFSPTWVGTTAAVSKNIEVGSVNDFNAAAGTSSGGGLITASTLTSAGIIVAGGGLQLADKPASTTCPAGSPSTSAGIIRFNATTPGMEFCDNDGGPAWVAVGSGGGGPGGSSALNGIDSLRDGIADTATTFAVGLGYGALCKFNAAANSDYGGCNVIGGATGLRNTAVGYQAGNALTSGNDNTAFGHQALLSLTTGSNNTAMGFQTLKTITTASNNTAAGYLALANDTASDNTAAGYYALNANTTGTGNTAAGHGVLYQTTTASGNTAAGPGALARATTGAGNTAAGAYALQTLTTGSGNTALGKDVLAWSNTTGSYNTMAGFWAGLTVTGNNNTGMGTYAIRNASNSVMTGTDLTAIGSESMSVTTSTTISQNTVVGPNALKAIGTDGNTAVGSSAGAALTTAIGDVAIGAASLSKSTTAGNWDVAVGYHTLFTAATAGNSNVAIGAEAARDKTTGHGSTAAGYQANAKATTSGFTTAAGYQAMFNNVTGASQSVGIGYQALLANTTAIELVAMGYQAAKANTVVGKDDITAIGYQAAMTQNNKLDSAMGSLAFSLSTSTNDTAFGYKALYQVSANNTVGVGYMALGTVGVMAFPCTALGASAFGASTTCTNFGIAVGSQAGSAAGAPGDFAAFGYMAGQLNTTGTGLTAFGWQALKANTSGNDNLALGADALSTNQTGLNNTAVGYRALKNNNRVAGSTGSNNTGIGYQALLNNTVGYSNTAVGYQSLMNPIGGVANTAVGNNALGGALVGTTVTGAATNAGKVQLTVASSTGFAAADVIVVDSCGGVGPLNGTRTIQTVDSATTITLTLAWVAGMTCPSGFMGAFGNTAVGVNALSTITKGAQNTGIGFNANPTTATVINTTCIGYNTCQGGTAVLTNGIQLGDANTLVISGQTAWWNYSDRRLKEDIRDSDLGLGFIMDLRPVSYRRINGNGKLDYGFVAQEVETALGGRETNIVMQRPDADKTYMLTLSEMLSPAVRALQQQEEAARTRQQDIDAMKTWLLNLQDTLQRKGAAP